MSYETLSILVMMNATMNKDFLGATFDFNNNKVHKRMAQSYNLFNFDTNSKDADKELLINQKEGEVMHIFLITKINR